jgi:hypothetical protein
VLGGQALERRRLVGGVVVDVQARVSGEPLVEEVEQPLEQEALVLAVVRPERGEAPVPIGQAVQVLERAPGLPEGVALDVVEEVAPGGSREQPEAALLLRRQQVVAVGARAPRGELE